MEEVNQSKKRYYKSVFRRVMSRYEEFKASNGTEGCANYYNVPNPPKGTDTGSYTPGVVKVSHSDFVCDVEMIARRVLTEHEWYYFRRVYIEDDRDFDSEVRKTLSLARYYELKHGVQVNLGKEFYKLEIYPVFQYLKPKDVR